MIWNCYLNTQAENQHCNWPELFDREDLLPWYLWSGRRLVCLDIITCWREELGVASRKAAHDSQGSITGIIGPTEQILPRADREGEISSKSSFPTKVKEKTSAEYRWWNAFEDGDRVAVGSGDASPESVVADFTSRVVWRISVFYLRYLRPRAVPSECSVSSPVIRGWLC